MTLMERLMDERLSLSFEVFPPKTGASLESVKEALENARRRTAKIQELNKKLSVIKEKNNDKKAKRN